MKLKSLELQGFKTFPDKTKLDFTSGITAVVGPNGSGKSNISDAVRWVLGEQSAKALRCSKMEDVVFNGTQQRKKTGYAQVTLSIDNSDRSLSFDGDEVSVTRRFYRSGNSEYLINNTAVRLQDIHELFMDTGLGRDGYSMIGQGKIDSIVSTKGEDRREIFEEAAGISKFRYRKADAERRLDKAEDNLVRLRDILTELEGRVEPLRIQSEKARDYLKFAEEKRSLEIALWLKTLERSSAEIKAQDDKILIAQNQHKDAEQALTNIQEETDRIYTKNSEYGIRLDEIRRSISAIEQTGSDKRSRISVLKNDIEHNSIYIDRVQGSIEEIKRNSGELTKLIIEKDAVINKTQSAISEKQDEIQRCTKRLEALKTDESLSGEKLDKINKELSSLTEKSSDAKIRYMTSASAIDDLRMRCESTDNSINEVSSRIGTLTGIVDEYKKMLADSGKNIDLLSRQQEDKKSEINELVADSNSIKETAEGLRLDCEQQYRKARILTDLENNLDGFTRSVKMVMKESKKGTLSGIHGPVSRVIKTPSEYSVAIETALSGALQNIVTTNDEDAKAAIRFLKSHDGGRATFLPMSTIKGRHLDERGLDSNKGFVGIAGDLCSCDECYKGILENLLGRIVVASDLDSAVSLAKRYSYRFKVVTLDGQVINAGGSLTGGSLTKNTGLLGRADEIEKLKAQAKAIKEKSDEQFARYSEAQKNIEKKNAALTELQDRIQQLLGDKLKIEAEIQGRQSELESAQKMLSDIRNEKADTLRRMEELNADCTAAKADLKKYAEQIKNNEDIVKTLTGSRNDFLQKREDITEKLQGLRIELLTMQNEMNAAKAEKENASIRAESDNDRLTGFDREIAQTRQKIKDAENEITVLTAEVQDCEKQIKEKQRETDNINSERLALEGRQSVLRREEREKNTEKENLALELARLDERRAALQKTYDDIVSKLWEEYELTKREAEDVAVAIDDPQKAQRRLSELKKKIKALGSVNVSAIEEYKEVSERYTFLSAQIGDVEKSKAELLHLITDLTKQMREIFIEKFNEINENFSHTFVELFGGGRASLSLSDPENILTTGIDISVEPPGKIVSHIELLSGGEKALVAIALYFAIMKVSPAPFCVMDEIEAALDDVNVYRFAAYLRRMNDNTQFICITHRRGTMEEADVLYGVTMQDRGISKLLELKAAEVARKLKLEAR